MSVGRELDAVREKKKTWDKKRLLNAFQTYRFMASTYANYCQVGDHNCIEFIVLSFDDCMEAWAT